MPASHRNRPLTVAAPAALLVLALLPACGHAPPPAPSLAPASEYRIGREDVIEVSVWKDTALSATVPVRPDGRISVPLIGDVVADGRTARELQDEIRRRLLPLVRDPVVAVIVREVNAPKLYIVGEVARPGVYPMRAPLNLLQAVALAGGFTEFARRGGITIIRREHGGERRYRARYGDSLNGGSVPMLSAGDTVVVP